MKKETCTVYHYCKSYKNKERNISHDRRCARPRVVVVVVVLFAHSEERRCERDDDKKVSHLDSISGLPIDFYQNVIRLLNLQLALRNRNAIGLSREDIKLTVN